MKIKFKFEHEVDLDRERKHLIDVFQSSDDALGRQLAILDCLENNDLAGVYGLYDNLPYSEEDGCSEKEFVGLWFDELVDKIRTTSAILDDRDSAEREVYDCNEIRTAPYRSKDRLVNESNDMIRVTIDMPIRDWRKLAPSLTKS